MKVCKECGQKKCLEEFYRHPEMKDGHLNICKKCKITYQRNRPSSAKAVIERRKNQKPKRKKALYERLCRWRRENPEKVREQAGRYPEKQRARNFVNNAVRDGKLTKEPCIVCASIRVHAHHEDYSKPLDVEWMCARCHRKRHEGRV